MPKEDIPPRKGSEIREIKKINIRNIGFSDEEVIEYLARKFNIKTIERKIEVLQSLGFTNPVSLIEKFPQIAGLDINRVLQSLQSLGFTNPVSLIEKYPQIAGHKKEKIERRLELFRKLNKIFNLQLDLIRIIETFPNYLAYDLRRIYFYLRIASFYNFDEKFYRRLITINPFLVFYVLYELCLQGRIFDKEEFKRLINKVSGHAFSKELKQNIINRIKNNLYEITEFLKQELTSEHPHRNEIKFLLKLSRYLEALLKK